MGKLVSLMDIIFKGKFFDWFYHFCISKSVLTNKHVFKKQSKRLKAIMMYATKHCDYYRKLGLKISSSDDLFKFPVLDKQLIRKLSTDSSPFVSDQIQKMVVYNGFTGGSTGEPLRLILSPGIDSLFQNRVWKEIGFKKGDIILAMDGTKLSAESILKDEYLALTSKKQLPYGGYALSSLYLKDTNISLYFDKICELKPAFIRGYPSFVYRVARYILDNDLTIGFKVKGIELTSEMAYPFQICVIEKAFRTKVYLQYGHTEAIAFGYTFDGTMVYRVEPLYGFLEVLDDSGKQVEIGETGEIVVTTLYNRAMPLIRYKTGDYAIYGGRDDRWVYLKTILGRTQDYIVGKDGEKVLLTALIFAQHFKALSNIKKWQLEQFEPGIVIAHIIKEDSFSYVDEKEIVTLFSENGNVETVFEYVDSIADTQRGKSKMLIQHITSI